MATGATSRGGAGQVRLRPRRRATRTPRPGAHPIADPGARPTIRRVSHQTAFLAASVAVLGLLAAACGTGTSSSGTASPGGSAAPGGGGGHVLQVVAAENTWGSLASQLGGDRVAVQSVVTDPNADPHQYESNPADARAFAAANLVIVNGAGYDTWADRLLSAQPEPGRTVLNVAALLGKKDGDNPHFWYGPQYVTQVVDRITADYEHLDPSGTAYFAARHAAVVAALAPYRSELAAITARYAGTPVASTESIFQYLASYLHLNLVTPYPFMQAVSDGNDPPAASVATFERQLTGGQVRVLVYNIQTVDPLTTSLQQLARDHHIPVVGVSETVDPANDTFQAWMVRQLSALQAALAAGTARS